MTDQLLTDQLIDGLYREGDPITDATAPAVPIDRRWQERQFGARLVNPANRRKLSVIIVGTGLAGASAGATLGEAGYQVKSFRSEEHTSELQSRGHLACRPPLAK